ncbi:hypothetical protein C6P40_002885 [Pichia californica]|uniref:Homing endonuclease LAGLIDADG domain-containing protein n=1 Tax=Pichia californica TaxID=460514 RepID=A0A9P7BEX6_9ASCO|nr:hypothetical protein C6P40_002885 [[Candida] californica]
MEDGGKVGSGLKLATNSFKYSDVLYLKDVLQKKYNLKVSIQKTGKENQYNIYIFKESMSDLIKIVNPYIINISNPTIQRFFALHYLLPFVLAALVVLHLIALHVHGSSNPIGITGNMDRLRLIDGDGTLGITQGEYSNCEIIVGIEDEKMLVQIQDKLGGSVKLRSGSNSIRYRLHNKKGMINLINRVNGNIRTSKRLVELNKVCLLLGLEAKYPCKLTKDNN